MNEDKREGFVFYRSFYEALAKLDPESRDAVFMAICQYGLDGIEPESEGIVSAIFSLVKPQIDANTKRYANGKKGGRPKSEPNDNQTETKVEPKQNQTETKTKPNDNQTKPNTQNSKPKDKDKVKDKDKEKEIYKAAKHKFGDYSHVLLSDIELEKLKTDYGEQIALDAITYLDEYIEMKGAKYKSHYLVIRKWVVDAVHEQAAKRANNPPIDERLRAKEERETQEREELAEVEKELEEVSAQLRQDTSNKELLDKRRSLVMKKDWLEGRLGAS